MTSLPMRNQVHDHLLTPQKAAQIYGLPIVLSTLNVTIGMNQPTIPELRAVLGGVEPLDRTTFNAWEDAEFVQAVQATGRRKLIMAALWTEVCLVFPALDALRDGYAVYPVVDAVAGASAKAHRVGLERIVQAGGQPVSLVQVICELQRDWARTETVPLFQALLFGSRRTTARGAEPQAAD